MNSIYIHVLLCILFRFSCELLLKPEFFFFSFEKSKYKENMKRIFADSTNIAYIKFVKVTNVI